MLGYVLNHEGDIEPRGRRPWKEDGAHAAGPEPWKHLATAGAWSNRGRTPGGCCSRRKNHRWVVLHGGSKKKKECSIAPQTTGYTLATTDGETALWNGTLFRVPAVPRALQAAPRFGTPSRVPAAPRAPRGIEAPVASRAPSAPLAPAPLPPSSAARRRRAGCTSRPLAPPPPRIG